MSDTARAVRMRIRGFTGKVVCPGDDRYDEARSVFNAMIDRRPAVIAQCARPEDVVAAIRFARERRLTITVRGGGHSVAGSAVADGGLTIDLRRMNRVVVDPDTDTVRVGGGATMGDLDRALQPCGRATTGGRVSTTGVGGYVLGGGTGWLDRLFGLACDNLVSVEIVTADGRRRVADERRNPDLFWALHGAGGNFGVATALTLRTHPLPAMSAAIHLWRSDRAEDVLRTFRDLIDRADDRVGGGAIYLTAPPEEFVPPSLVGTLVLMVLVTCAGSEAAVRAAVRPLSALAPDAEVITELPYADLQCLFDDPPGMRNYWSAEHLMALPDEAIAAFHGARDGMPVPSSSQHALLPGGGAAARAPADYPIPWRTAPWTVHPFGMWEDRRDDARGIAWTKAVRAAVRPWATGDVYLNFTGDEGVQRVRAGLGERNWERLVAVKRAFDPDNVFHANHNIPPG